jgi:hypothetical protein
MTPSIILIVLTFVSRIAHYCDDSLYCENPNLPYSWRLTIRWFDDFYWHDMLLTVVVFLLGLMIYRKSRRSSAAAIAAGAIMGSIASQNEVWPPPPRKQTD